MPLLAGLARPVPWLLALLVLLGCPARGGDDDDSVATDDDDSVDPWAEHCDGLGIEPLDLTDPDDLGMATLVTFTHGLTLSEFNDVFAVFQTVMSTSEETCPTWSEGKPGGDVGASTAVGGGETTAGVRSEGELDASWNWSDGSRGSSLPVDIEVLLEGREFGWSATPWTGCSCSGGLRPAWGRCRSTGCRCSPRGWMPSLPPAARTTGRKERSCPPTKGARPRGAGPTSPSPKPPISSWWIPPATRAPPT